MPRRIERYLIVNAITGEIKLRTFARGLTYAEVAYPLIITLPEVYPGHGDPINITLPAVRSPEIEALTDLEMVGEEVDAS